MATTRPAAQSISSIDISPTTFSFSQLVSWCGRKRCAFQLISEPAIASKRSIKAVGYLGLMTLFGLFLAPTAALPLKNRKIRNQFKTTCTNCRKSVKESVITVVKVTPRFFGHLFGLLIHPHWARKIDQKFIFELNTKSKLDQFFKQNPQVKDYSANDKESSPDPRADQQKSKELQMAYSKMKRFIGWDEKQIRSQTQEFEKECTKKRRELHPDKHLKEQSRYTKKTQKFNRAYNLIKKDLENALPGQRDERLAVEDFLKEIEKTTDLKRLAIFFNGMIVHLSQWDEALIQNEMPLFQKIYDKMSLQLKALENNKSRDGIDLKIRLETLYLPTFLLKLVKVIQKKEFNFEKVPEDPTPFFNQFFQEIDSIKKCFPRFQNRLFLNSYCLDRKAGLTLSLVQLLKEKNKTNEIKKVLDCFKKEEKALFLKCYLARSRIRFNPQSLMHVELRDLAKNLVDNVLRLIPQSEFDIQFSTSF